VSDVTASAGEKPSAIRARLDKFKTVEDFIQGYSQYFFRGGLLLPTRNTRPEGTRVSLSLEIDGGITVVKAEGVVQQVRMGANGAPIGMVIRFVSLDPGTAPMVERALEARKGSGRRPMVYTSEVPAIGVPREAAPAPAPPPVSGSEAIDALASALDSTFDSIFGPSSTGTAHPVVAPAATPSTDAAISDFLGDDRDQTLLGVPQPFAKARPASNSGEISAFPGQPTTEPAAELGSDPLSALFAQQPPRHEAPEPAALDSTALPRPAAEAILSDFFGAAPAEIARPTPVTVAPSAPSASDSGPPRTVMGMRAIGDELVPRPAAATPAGDPASDPTNVLGRIAFAKVSRAELEASKPVRETPAPAILPPPAPPAPPAAPSKPSHLRELLGAITSEHSAVTAEDIEEIYSQHDAGVEQQLMRRLHESQSGLAAGESGNDALDALVSAAPGHAAPRSPTSDLPAVPHSQLSIFGRFMAWLRGLFGR
jgi:uncharacterized protein (TIGR02266 family)